MFTSAFVQPRLTSTFLGTPQVSRTCRLRPASASVRVSGVRMMADKEEPKAAPAPKKRGFKLPVTSGKKAAPKKEEEDTEGLNETEKRGLGLVVEDLKKNLPEVVGVGRQDTTGYMKPQPGEPGYKPQAYETTFVSDLGISTFSDDKNYVSKVGGLDAIKKAAKEVNAGAKAEEIKKAVLKAETIKKEEPKVYSLPDYLMPLPEDTPRKGMSWVNIIPK